MSVHVYLSHRISLLPNAHSLDHSSILQLSKALRSIELKGALFVVGLDAANVSRGSARERAHQFIQLRLEL